MSQRKGCFMSRKRMYMISLIGFFSIWGMFGFTVNAPRTEAVFQATLPPVEPTQMAPGVTPSTGIPVTGKSEPSWTEILGFYGLIGLTTLFLMLAMLNLANKSTALHVEHKQPPTEKAQKN